MPTCPSRPSMSVNWAVPDFSARRPTCTTSMPPPTGSTGRGRCAPVPSISTACRRRSAPSPLGWCRIFWATPTAATGSGACMSPCRFWCATPTATSCCLSTRGAASSIVTMATWPWGMATMWWSPAAPCGASSPPRPSSSWWSRPPTTATSCRTRGWWAITLSSIRRRSMCPPSMNVSWPSRMRIPGRCRSSATIRSPSSPGPSTRSMPRGGTGISVWCVSTGATSARWWATATTCPPRPTPPSWRAASSSAPSCRAPSRAIPAPSRCPSTTATTTTTRCSSITPGTSSAETT